MDIASSRDSLTGDRFFFITATNYNIFFSFRVSFLSVLLFSVLVVSYFRTSAGMFQPLFRLLRIDRPLGTSVDESCCDGNFSSAIQEKKVASLLQELFCHQHYRHHRHRHYHVEYFVEVIISMLLNVKLFSTTCFDIVYFFWIVQCYMYFTLGLWVYTHLQAAAPKASHILYFS